MPPKVEPSDMNDGRVIEICEVLLKFKEAWNSGDQLALAAEPRRIPRLGIVNVDDQNGAHYYLYDGDLYPELTTSLDVNYEPDENNASLAEQFIWKQGDWLKYKRFLEALREDKEQIRSRKSIVHAAFAFHLRELGGNKPAPIFDQHSARALWAICNEYWDETGSVAVGRHYQNSLTKSNGKEWCGSPSSRTSLGDCWTDFVERLRDWSGNDKKTMKEADKVLMPLGQALKDATKYLVKHAAGWTVDPGKRSVTIALNAMRDSGVSIRDGDLTIVEPKN